MGRGRAGRAERTGWTEAEHHRICAEMDDTSGEEGNKDNPL